MEEMTSSLNVIAERLGKSEVFQNLPEKDLLEIAKFTHEDVFQDGQEIFVEGEPANKILVVERGKLAIEKKIQLGRHSTPRNATIAYVNPDQIAGFSTLTKSQQHSASVIAIEPTRVCVIDGNELRAYLAEHPQAGYEVISAITSLVRGRYQSATNTSVSYTHLTLPTN